MISSKQRSYLRSISNKLETILIIGKNGIDDNIINQAYDALNAREIIKAEVLKNSMIDAREACEIICSKVNADPVQVIGNKFIMYKPSKEKPTIVLPK